MLQKLVLEAQTVITGMKYNFPFALKIAGILCLIHIINFITSYSLNNLGIRPRTFRGLLCIPLAPFLHSNFGHLFFNTIPLVVLIDLLLINGQILFYKITIMLILITGFLIWLIGKRGIYIGASAVIMGYFGYLIARTYFHTPGITFILAGLVIYYFGSLIFSIFPSAQKNVSWAGHLFGLLTGIGIAFFLAF